MGYVSGPILAMLLVTGCGLLASHGWPDLPDAQVSVIEPGFGNIGQLEIIRVDGRPVLVGRRLVKVRPGFRGVRVALYVSGTLDVALELKPGHRYLVHWRADPLDPTRSWGVWFEDAETREVVVCDIGRLSEAELQQLRPRPC